MADKKILVQKYGGTSVSTAERRKQVIDHVRRARDNGYQVAIVVSAMGRSGDPYATDTLLDLLRVDGKNVDKRDYDMVFVCGETLSAAYMSHLLKLDGIPALGLTGAQAGFITDENHAEANIIEIDTSRIKRHLFMGEVPVVAGCQGASGVSGDFMTLGRGGSDTSGVALGAALDADKVEIFTDVEGVARVDPRLVPKAELLDHIHYDSMLEMACYGAGVVHPRAVRAGMEAGLPIVVRSTFSNNPGTMINAEPNEYPLVGLAKKGPFVTATLNRDRLGLEIRTTMEKELLVMSLMDEDTGQLILGVDASKSDELIDFSKKNGFKIELTSKTQVWVTLVGEIYRGLGVKGRRALETSGVDVSYYESYERRVTYCLSSMQDTEAVKILYNTFFSQ